jgi:hypothetical protein
MFEYGRTGKPAGIYTGAGHALGSVIFRDKEYGPNPKFYEAWQRARQRVANSLSDCWRRLTKNDWGMDAEPGDFEVALGLDPVGQNLLEEFAERGGGQTYRSWAPNLAPTPFEESFKRAMDRASTIHFNLQGMDLPRARAYKGDPFYEHLTDWEYNQIRKNPAWRRKTKLYGEPAVP